MDAEEEYFVKVSGANVVYTRVDTVKSMLRRLKRLKMELEENKKESIEKKRLLVAQIKEAIETIRFIEKSMPKAKKRSKKEEAKKERKETVRTGKRRTRKKPGKKPKVSAKTVTELSDLRSELEKLKKELEE